MSRVEFIAEPAVSASLPVLLVPTYSKLCKARSPKKVTLFGAESRGGLRVTARLARYFKTFLTV